MKIARVGLEVYIPIYLCIYIPIYIYAVCTCILYNNNNNDNMTVSGGGEGYRNGPDRLAAAPRNFGGDISGWECARLPLPPPRALSHSLIPCFTPSFSLTLSFSLACPIDRHDYRCCRRRWAVHLARLSHWLHSNLGPCYGSCEQILSRVRWSTHYTIITILHNIVVIFYSTGNSKV